MAFGNNDFGNDWGNSPLDNARKKQIVESCDRLHDLLASGSANTREIAEHLSQLFDRSGTIRTAAIIQSTLNTNDLLKLQSIVKVKPKANFLIHYNINADNEKLSAELMSAPLKVLPEKINPIYNRLIEQLNRMLKSSLIDDKNRKILRDTMNQILSDYYNVIQGNQDNNLTNKLEGLLLEYQHIEKQFATTFYKFNKAEENEKAVGEEVTRLYAEDTQVSKPKTTKPKEEAVHKPKEDNGEKRRLFKEAGKQKGRVDIKEPAPPTPKSEQTPKVEQKEVYLKKPSPKVRGLQAISALLARAGKIGAHTDPKNPKLPATDQEIQKARKSVNDELIAKLPNKKPTPSCK